MKAEIKVLKGQAQRVVFLESCLELSPLKLRIYRCLSKIEEIYFLPPALVINGGLVYVDFTQEDTEDLDGLYSWRLIDGDDKVVEMGKIRFA